MRTSAVVCFMLIVLKGAAQSSDTKYEMPLREVVKDIEVRYGVTIRDPDSLTRGKTLPYAQWRYRVDAEQTLYNVLAPVDLVAQKEGIARYKLVKYQYHRISVEEGKEKLDYLSNLYHDKTTWESRKAELRQCMLEATGLDNIPESPNTPPVIINKRKRNGYTVENIAIETLPGLYVCGSLYKPSKIKGKAPLVLCPNGHTTAGRYHPDVQIRCAMLARMGAIAINYDLFAYGESQLQFKPEDHRRSLAMTIQVLNSTRILDYLTSLPEASAELVAITGASGGGSHTMLMTALDDRIKVSIPVVMLSCYFYGGCPCESGLPIHLCGKGTNNAEIAAMAAPRPQLVVSDGGDWSDHVPEIEYPYLQTIYGYYDRTENIENKHFPDEGHDYAFTKRAAVYPFLAYHLGLNIKAIQNKTGDIDESVCTVEEAGEMQVFGENGKHMPQNALKDFSELEKVWNHLKETSPNPQISE